MDKKLNPLFCLLLGMLFLAVNNLIAQDISGYWHWQSENNHHMFTLNLEYTYPDTIRGNHCGVFRNGRRIDCALDKYSLKLTQREPTVYQGTIRSSYSNTRAEIRLTYSLVDSTIFFERIRGPKGESYIPNQVTLRK